MAKICSRCGNTIQDEINPTCYTCLRMDNDQKRYGRHSRPTNPQPPSPSYHRNRKPVKKTIDQTSNPPVIVNRDLQRKAINSMLADLYGSPRFLSNILQDGNLTPQQIHELKKNHGFFDELVSELIAFWKKKLRWQECEMLRSKYSLDGKPIPTKVSLMKQFNFSWDQINEYRKQGLYQLQMAGLVSEWEKLVVKTAKKHSNKKGK